MSACLRPFLLIAPLINGEMMRHGRLKATCGAGTVAVERLPRHVRRPLVPFSDDLAEARREIKIEPGHYSPSAFCRQAY